VIRRLIRRPRRLPLEVIEARARWAETIALADARLWQLIETGKRS